MLRLEDPYVGAMFIGAPRPTEALRSSKQADPTPAMTVPTQDDVGWTWLSHHCFTPAPPRGTPTRGMCRMRCAVDRESTQGQTLQFVHSPLPSPKSAATDGLSIRALYELQVLHWPM